MTYTREQIMSMSAGLELDAIVCELIYGWRRIKGPKTDYEGSCEYGDVLIPPTILNEDEAYRMMKPRGEIPFDYFVNRRYSSIMTAAMELENKVCTTHEHAMRYVLKLTETMNLGHYRNLSYLAKLIRATPEQRTKAAILATMDQEVKDNENLQNHH